MRTRPQVMYSQSARASSSIIQCTASQGSPLLLLSVAMRPSFRPAQPSFGGGPECSVVVESQIADTALAESVGG